MTKQEVLKKYKKRLANGSLKVYVAIQDIGYSKEHRSKFPYLMPYIYAKGDMIPIIDDTNTYWVKTKRAYALNIHGSSQTFELVYSLLYPYTNFKIIFL